MPDDDLIPRRCADMQERVGKLEQKAETALESIPRIHERLDGLQGQQQSTALKLGKLAAEVAMAGALVLLLFKDQLFPSPVAPPAPTSTSSTP